jgi:hypothetical protein
MRVLHAPEQRLFVAARMPDPGRILQAQLTARVFSDRDGTFRGPGGVGLWSSGDADVSFDDFRVQARPERPR